MSQGERLVELVLEVVELAHVELHLVLPELSVGLREGVLIGIRLEEVQQRADWMVRGAPHVGRLDGLPWNVAAIELIAAMVHSFGGARARAAAANRGARRGAEVAATA